MPICVRGRAWVRGRVVLRTIPANLPATPATHGEREAVHRRFDTDTDTDTPAGGWPPAGGAHRRRVGSYRVH